MTISLMCLTKLKVLFYVTLGTAATFLVIKQALSYRSAGTTYSIGSTDPVIIGTVDQSKIILIYNRVPKTASTTFMDVTYRLAVATDAFKIIYVNTTFKHLTPIDQMVISESMLGSEEKLPTLYHGHFAYFDVTRLASNPNNRKVLYINMVREPMERFVSHYYFLRYGDNFRPHLRRKRMGDKETIDDCVRLNHHDCQPIKFWVQIPYFCGEAFYCREPGNAYALQMAKYNLVNKYFLVGTTERLTDFIILLEHAIPKIFGGAREILKESNHKSNGTMVWKRKTVVKIYPSPETLEILKGYTSWKMENEFYLFASRLFDDNLNTFRNDKFRAIDAHTVFRSFEKKGKEDLKESVMNNAHLPIPRIIRTSISADNNRSQNLLTEK